jgi:phosphohistidine phosphatase
MRKLTLVRHAKSSWDSAALNDFERPLNERGRRDAPLMAERARHLLGRPDALVSSPALRALATAQLFAEALGFAREEIMLQPAIYEATRQTLLKIVQGLPERDAAVMLFGHNPGFSELAHALAECPFEDLPTCALVQIELPVKHWREVKPGTGRVLQYSFPKQDKN